VICTGLPINVSAILHVCRSLVNKFFPKKKACKKLSVFVPAGPACFSLAEIVSCGYEIADADDAVGVEVRPAVVAFVDTRAEPVSDENEVEEIGGAVEVGVARGIGNSSGSRRRVRADVLRHEIEIRRQNYFVDRQAVFASADCQHVKTRLVHVDRFPVWRVIAPEPAVCVRPRKVFSYYRIIEFDPARRPTVYGVSAYPEVVAGGIENVYPEFNSWGETVVMCIRGVRDVAYEASA